MNLLMKGAALAPPFSCTTKYSSDVYSPRPPDIRVRLLPTKPPVHFTTEQPGRDNKHILLYEHNAFTSHLMLDSDEVYQMTKRGLDAAQISAAKRIHLNLVLVKLLELHHLGYDLRHYHAQHHAFIKQFNLPAHFQFDVATD